MTIDLQPSTIDHLMPNITALPAAEFSAELRDRWLELSAADPTLDSPYFRPEFTEAVAAVRDDVEVAVFEQGGEVVGLFPLQRGRLGAGHPVGGRLNDFHGPIVSPEIEWTAEEFLSGCRLQSWRFTHLPAAQLGWGFGAAQVDHSYYLDLSRGYDAYKAGRKQAGSNEVTKIERKIRKLVREVGPLRLVPHTADRTVFDTLLQWKSRQYRTTGVADVFAHSWTVALLERLLDADDHSGIARHFRSNSATQDDFRGMLSALYVGDRPAAIHFGMVSRGVLHYWFPAYDREFEKYSPGLILLLELARAGEELGIRRIDLGAGRKQYKQSLGSDSIAVAEGCIERDGLRRLARRAWRRTRDWVRNSPLRRPAEAALHAIRPLREWWSFR